MTTRAWMLGVIAGLWTAVAADGNWPSFRGPAASGVLVGADPPTRWDVEKGEGVRWKAPIPGLGHSSPVIWGDSVFVASAVGDADQASLKVGLYGDISAANDTGPQRWVLLCVEKRTGAIRWQQTAKEGVPAGKRHTKATHANTTPATDGKHVVVNFGSEGLYAYDATGQLLWRKDLGRLAAAFYMVPSAEWGFGSSPVIYQDLVLVQCDVLTNSFLAAFDVRDGQQRWRTPRDDTPTWSTPTVMKQGDRVQVVVNGYRHAGGYDLLTGKEIWRLSGGGDIPTPTPVVAEDLIFLTSAHGSRAPIYAIKAGAVGDISLAAGQTNNANIAWSVSRRGNYMQTPLVLEGLLYCCHDTGVLSCYDARAGTLHYSERLGSGGDGFTASAVAAAGRVYCTSEQGAVYVVKAGPRFEVTATNSLGETCLASPASSGDGLFFRTRHRLVALGNPVPGR